MVRARMAFNTMRNIIRGLETVQHLRKVVIYLSGGYDFNPFLAERTRYHPTSATGNPINTLARSLLDADGGTILSDALSDGELTREIAELAAAANQAKRFVLHRRSARAGCRTRGRPFPVEGQQVVQRVDLHGAEQPAFARGVDRRPSHREPERLRRGISASRRRDERLLHPRLCGGRFGRAGPEVANRSARFATTSACSTGPIIRWAGAGRTSRRHSV